MKEKSADRKKSIKEIYDSLKGQDETVLFQVKRRAILNMMLREFETVDNWIYWDKYKEIPLKEIYLCVGSWRIGMAGIFCSSFRDSYGDYCFDNFCIDWKSDEIAQQKQKIKVNKFIEIMDKYRDDIRISRKKYEDFEK